MGKNFTIWQFQFFSQIDGICYDLTSKITLRFIKSGGTSEWND
jgi:hypothetical protein